VVLLIARIGRLTIRSIEAAGRAGSEINVVRRGPVNGAISLAITAQGCLMAEHKPHPSNVPGDFYVENKRGAAKKSEKIWGHPLFKCRKNPP